MRLPVQRIRTIRVSIEQLVDPCQMESEADLKAGFAHARSSTQAERFFALY